MNRLDEKGLAAAMAVPGARTRRLEKSDERRMRAFITAYLAATSQDEGWRPPPRELSEETKAELKAIDDNIRNAAIMAPHIFVGQGGNPLSPARNGCTCACHRTPGIVHVKDCCPPLPPPPEGVDK